jgi:hypothetical protein
MRNAVFFFNPCRLGAFPAPGPPMIINCSNWAGFSLAPDCISFCSPPPQDNISKKNTVITPGIINKDFIFTSGFTKSFLRGVHELETHPKPRVRNLAEVVIFSFLPF